MKSSQTGVYGIGVMGKATVVQDVMEEYIDQEGFFGAGSFQNFFQLLEKPQKVLLMIDSQNHFKH